MTRLTVKCPGCEATMVIDAESGAVISHAEKSRALGSFEELKNDLGKQKEVRDALFSQEMSSLKDRERILEEKFKEAMKRADLDKDKPFKNPLDMD